jgi:hypothetical protein
MKTNIKKILDKGGISIDWGSGEVPQKGFLGVDRFPHRMVDIVMDLEDIKAYQEFPPGCASLMMASNIVEHFKPWLFMQIMDEWWRIMKVGGELMIATPYAGSHLYWQDPTHCNGCNETTWEYFDPFGRKSNGQFYKIYRPMPWEVVPGKDMWDIEGNLEVVLRKRADDTSYHKWGSEGSL